MPDDAQTDTLHAARLHDHGAWVNQACGHERYVPVSWAYALQTQGAISGPATDAAREPPNA